MAISLREVRRIPNIQEEEEREQAKTELASKVCSSDELKAILDEYDSAYRYGQEMGEELGELMKALEEGPADVAVALEVLPDAVIGRRRAGTLEKFHNVNGFHVEPGDIIFISKGVLVGIGKRSLQNLIITDEVRVTKVYPDIGSVEIDYGIHGGTQIATLSGELMDRSSELKVGTLVLASRNYNMVFQLADSAEAVEEPLQGQLEDKLVFAGFYKYRQFLAENLINPLVHFERFDGPVVAVIGGTTGLGKTHGVLWSIQEVKNKGLQVNLQMLSPADLKSGIFSGTEHKIKDAFDSLVATAEKGIPSVLLLNEGETTTRDRVLHTHSSVRDTLDGAVATVLASVDIWRAKYSHLPLAMVITTNFALDIDAALLNDHRLSAMTTLDYPETVQEIQEIVTVYVPEGDNREEIIERLTDRIASTPLIRVTDEHGAVRDIEWADMCTPAIISGICHDAKKMATNDSLMNGKKVRLAWDHYTRATEKRIGTLAGRLSELRIARTMLPVRIKEKMGHIVRVQPIYSPEHR